MNAKKFVAHYIIRENLLDSFGHMNNAAYLVLLEMARWDFLAANGFGMKKMQEIGIGPTILEINIKFHRELRVRDEVDIETQMISYEGKIAKLQQKILIGDIVYSTAEFTIGLFDIKKRKLILPTPEWLAAIGMD